VRTRRSGAAAPTRPRKAFEASFDRFYAYPAAAWRERAKVTGETFAAGEVVKLYKDLFGKAPTFPGSDDDG
jgi:hypothetical protein